jgi:biopolymer transport protein ExbD
MLGLNMVRVSPRGRPKNRTNHLICSIDATGFAGIMFVLVWLLMAPFMHFAGHRREVSVDMPRVLHPVSMLDADREDAMRIGITREGRVFFGNDIIRPSDLPRKIEERVGNSAGSKIYIRADARAKYGWVKELLEGVQASGVEKIGFLVDQRRTPTKPSQPSQ